MFQIYTLIFPWFTFFQAFCMLAVSDEHKAVIEVLLYISLRAPNSCYMQLGSIANYRAEVTLLTLRLKSYQARNWWAKYLSLTPLSIVRIERGKVNRLQSFQGGPNHTMLTPFQLPVQLRTILHYDTTLSLCNKSFPLFYTEFTICKWSAWFSTSRTRYTFSLFLIMQEHIPMACLLLL